MRDKHTTAGINAVNSTLQWRSAGMLRNGNTSKSLFII